jgi:hypothetical protein
MNEGLKSQIAAIIGLILLAVIAVAPWEAETHWLTPLETQWQGVIKHKNDLIIQMSGIQKDISAFPNIPDKQNANQEFTKSISLTTPDELQGYVTSNPKYQVASFKAGVVPESHELRMSLVAKFNPFGQLMTDLWNNYEFMEITSMIVKPNPSRPDEEVSATIGIRLPQ